METKNQESKIQRGPDETNLKAQCLSTVAGLSTGSRSYLKLILIGGTLLLILGVGCQPAPELKCKLYNHETTVICEKADGTKILALVWREKK